MHSNKPQEFKKLLLLGKTGVGKTSWVNRIHDMYNLKFDLNQADESGDVTVSQTSQIKSYSINLDNVNYDIIDTPGIFDTNIHKRKHNRENLLSYLQDNQVNAIAIVTPASEFRNNEINRQLLEDLQTIFPQEIKNHLIIIVTFSSGGKDAKNIQSFYESILPKNTNLTNKIFTFNNDYNPISTDTDIDLNSMTFEDQQNYILTLKYREQLSKLLTSIKPIKLLSSNLFTVKKQYIDKLEHLNNCVKTQTLVINNLVNSVEHQAGEISQYTLIMERNKSYSVPSINKVTYLICPNGEMYDTNTIKTYRPAVHHKWKSGSWYALGMNGHHSYKTEGNPCCTHCNSENISGHKFETRDIVGSPTINKPMKIKFETAQTEHDKNANKLKEFIRKLKEARIHLKNDKNLLETHKNLPGFLNE